MKNYYFNPANRDLIIFDTDAQDVQIVERIEKVRVWVKGEVRLGDFDGPNGGETPEDAIARTGKYGNHNITRLRKEKKKAPPRRMDGRRTITCKNCGQTGHFAKTCPNAPKSPASEGL